MNSDVCLDLKILKTKVINAFGLQHPLLAYTEMLKQIVSFLAMLYVNKGFNFKSIFKTLYLAIKIALLFYVVLLISTTKHFQVATILKIYYAITASDLIKFIKTPVSHKCMLDCKNKQPIKYFFFEITIFHYTSIYFFLCQILLIYI